MDFFVYKTPNLFVCGFQFHSSLTMQSVTVNDFSFSYGISGALNVSLPRRKLVAADLVIINSTMDLMEAIRPPVSSVVQLLSEPVVAAPVEVNEPMPPVPIESPPVIAPIRSSPPPTLAPLRIPVPSPALKRTAASVVGVPAPKKKRVISVDTVPCMFMCKFIRVLDLRGECPTFKDNWGKHFCFAYKGVAMDKERFREIGYLHACGTTRGDMFYVYVDCSSLRRTNTDNVYARYNSLAGVTPINPSPVFDGGCSVCILPPPTIKDHIPICMSVIVFQAIAEDRKAGAKSFWLWP